MIAPNELLKKMHAELASKNIQFRIVPIDKVNALEAEISKTLTDKVPKKEIADFAQSCYDFDYSKHLQNAKTIIVASVLDPQGQLQFQRENKIVTIYVAPGYLKLPAQQLKPSDAFTTYFKESEYQVKRVSLPAKLLAVKSGLARYGKNNITYVDGFGSYHRLGTYVSDFPAYDEEWGDVQALEKCSDCKICNKNCPTGAISKEHFIIDAERCITYYNERDVEFPAWINKKWHNSLFGCLLCQQNCPYNREVCNQAVIHESFTEDETNLFLTEDVYTALPLKMQEKIKDLGYQEYYPTLVRNLRLLF